MAKTMALVGKVAFVVGVLFAIVGGIWGGKSVPTNDFVIVVLLIAGILIGLLNITAKEAATVLSAAVALIILGIWFLTGLRTRCRCVSGASGELGRRGLCLCPAHGASSHHHRHQSGDFYGQSRRLIPFESRQRRE
jgi:hypothetical protein